MMYVFFLSASNILDSNIAPIFEISIFSDRKMNLDGTFGKLKSIFRKRQEKKKK